MTMRYITSVTVNSTTGLFELTDIPSNFTHLQARMYSRLSGSTASYYGVYLNNDTTSGNYYLHGSWGDGSGVASQNAQNNQVATYGMTVPNSSQTANTWGAAIIDIFDYSNTSKNKTVRWTHGVDLNGSGSVGYSTGVWLSTSAINRLSFNTGSTFAIGTRVDLYGITNNPIATGA